MTKIFALKHYLLLVLTLSQLSLAGCSKSREAKLPDSAQDSIFPISSFDGKTGEITTSKTEVQSLSTADKLKAFGEGQFIKVDKVNIPGVPKAMFADLYINGQAGKSYKVIFNINQHYILLSKIVPDLKELSTLEKQISQTFGNEFKVPLFLFNIQSHGTLERITDSYNEATSSLRLKPASWESSSYISLSFLSKDRYPVDNSPSNLDLRDEIFLVNKINKKLFKAQELKNQLKIDTILPPESMTLLKLNGRQLIVYEITQFSQLTPSQQEIILQGKSTGEYAKCDQETLNKLKDEDKDNCVIIARFKIEIDYKKAELSSVQFDRSLSTTVQYKTTSDSLQADFIHIQPNKLPEEIIPTNLLDPRKSFSATELQGEFLFRRTLNDSANAFPWTFPGSQGPLEIVQFVLAEDRVVVKKVDPLLKQNGQTDLDSEEIMSLPAQYFKLKEFDENGNKLAIIEKTEARFDDPGVMIEIDWTSNSIPNLLSPLNYYYVGSCFSAQGGQGVTDMQQDLKNGILNFSLEGSYVVSPNAPSCTSHFMTSDYSLKSLEQRTFSFKERISFKKYDGKNDDNILLDLPFYAQKQFNFGVFTSSKLMPNKNGNIGRENTEVQLPNLFDFKNNKTVTYTLAGLPKTDVKLRQAVIAATQRVIDGWNSILHQAFKGSPLETTRDLIQLEVEGRDISNVQLGDLNKNFIWYLHKPIASGVLGIGGPSANPRSGVIESSDIIIYGGNLKTSMESVFKRAEAKAYYEKMLKFTPAPVKPNNEASGLSANSSEENSSLSTSPEESLLSPQQTPYISQKFSDSNLLQTENLPLTFSRVQQSVTSHLRDPLNLISKQNLLDARSNSKAVALQKIFEELARKGNWNAQTSQGLVNKHLSEAMRNEIDENSFQMMQSEAAQSEFITNITTAINSGHQVIEMIDGSHSSGDKSVLEKDPFDFFIEKYEAVLVHEMGHALGLTHNFEGSFDKNNLTFAHEASTMKRPSSSVMDYLPLEIWEGSSPAPYDLHAIRAAYTGRIEVSEKLQAQAKPSDHGDSSLDIGNGQSLVLNMGKFVQFKDIKKLAGLASWLDLDTSSANIIPLKKYKYCPDVDVRRYPTCNRFDVGTSPQEIVDNMIKDYQAFYLLNNFADQRIRFDWWNSGGYIARLFSTFQGMRHFMDESIFRLFQGDQSQATIDLAIAALKGMQFMHSVIRQPEADTNSSLNKDTRFVELELQDKSKVTIEKKWTRDIIQPGTQARMQVRGIEYDKAIALINLTVRRIGVPEYEYAGVRMSYPDFEKIFLGQDLKSPLELPTMSLIAEILNHNIRPSALTPQGNINLAGLPEFKVKSTELIRSISVQSAILNLDINTLEESSNFAAQFRFGNNLGNHSPKDVQVLTSLGNKSDSDTSLKYWAFDNAHGSQLLTNNAKALRDLIDHQEELKALFIDLFKQKDQQDESDFQEAKSKLEKLLADFSESIGPKDLNVILEYMESQAQTVHAIMDQFPDNEAVMLKVASEQIKPQNEYFAENFPIVAIIQKALIELDTNTALAKKILTAMVPSSYTHLEVKYGIIFSNIELLNRLFYLARPEYNN